MGYKILVCDDSQIHINILVKHINKCLNEANIKFICDTSMSGIRAVKMYAEKNYDIVFLDIDMPDCNGIDAAGKIFSINPDAVIIYVTAYPEFAGRAYEQFIFQYITKPIDEFRLGIILKKALDKIEKDMLFKEEQSYFIIKKKNKDIKIFDRDVIYFEKVVNYTTIYMESGKELNIRISYKELENIMDMRLYMRCHSGFIVNKSKIKSITSKEIEMFNADNKIPIGRGYKEMVSEALKEYWNEKI